MFLGASVVMQNIFFFSFLLFIIIVFLYIHPSIPNLSSPFVQFTLYHLNQIWRTDVTLAINSSLWIMSQKQILLLLDKRVPTVLFLFSLGAVIFFKCCSSSIFIILETFNNLVDFIMSNSRDCWPISRICVYGLMHFPL